MTRVLVVDDEIDTLNLLRTILEISGYQAFTTLNSVDAITLAEVEHPDCVLLDIMMPQLDGFTLCKMMRLHPATQNLPIVFVTAYSALDLEERRLEAGADMVLPKPIGMDVLIEAVEKATAMRSTRAPEVPPAPAVPTTSDITTPKPAPVDGNKPAVGTTTETTTKPAATVETSPKPAVEPTAAVEAAPKPAAEPTAAVDATPKVPTNPSSN
jgi:CheY-like chemotaxis protein